MIDTTPGYYDLRIEDTWIDYLRTRLPYSFNRIEERGSGSSRHYVLSEPVLLTGTLAAKRHNFWRRGNVYYMSGKLLDYYDMSEVGRNYRTVEVLQLLTDTASAPYIWPSNAFVFYNSMQMEKVWGFAQDNHLDRERVMMTNVVLAVELCLKAVLTHATFRETGSFKFNTGHDVSKLYRSFARITPRRNLRGIRSVCQTVCVVQGKGRGQHQANLFSSSLAAANQPR